MREDNVLQNVIVRNGEYPSDKFFLDPKGLILGVCGDGHHSLGTLTHLAQLYESAGCTDACLHLVPRNGGALKLVPESPAYKPRRTVFTDFMDDVVEASAAKDIKTLALFVHTPCAIARMHNLSFLEQMNLLFLAKSRVKKNLLRRKESISVACMVHVTYDPRHKRIYAVTRPSFVSWSGKNQAKFT